MLHEDNKPYEEDVTVKTEVKPEVKKEEPLVNDQGTGEEEDGGVDTLLADLKKPTDKDADKTTVVGNTNPDPLNPSGSQTIVKKGTQIIYQNHELIAKLTVAAMNVMMGLILQFIADDWTEDAEKKFTLSQTRKNEIIEPLTLVLEQAKSKYNPVVILCITILVAYVPMFITAIRARKAKAKLKTQKKLNTAAIEEVEEDGETAEERLKKELDNIGKEEKESVKIVTKEVFKYTKAQQDRLKKIKSTRGRRSESDIKFLKDMGLDGLV
jgi:hypothetical protein